MATKRLQMRQIREVLRLKHEGRLVHRAIARACGMGAATVSDYLGRVRAAGLSWPLPEGMDDRELEARLFPAPPPGESRPRPDPAQVHEELQKAGVTLLGTAHRKGASRQAEEGPPPTRAIARRGASLETEKRRSAHLKWPPA